MKRTHRAHLPVLALTHPGMRGKNNEDCYAITAFRMEAEPETPGLLAVLSDGIGGHRAGEVAAEMAVNLITAYVLENGETMEPLALLDQAITAASRAIHEQARADRERNGMGATCACALILANRLYIASLGDSRVYLLRGGQLLQLTTDHTWIQEALARGILNPEQAAGHPNTHVIRRFLGSPTPAQVDLRMRLSGNEDDQQALSNQGMSLQDDDLVLLTSDGLTDLVRDEEIAAALQNLPLHTAAQNLIDLANQRGGHDNISLVLIETIPHALLQPAPIRETRRWWLAGCAASLVILLLAAGLVSRLWIFDGDRPALSASPTAAFVQPSPAMSATPTPVLPLGSPTPPRLPTPLNQPARTLPSPGLGEPSLTPWPTYTPMP
ncbi:MAG: protein phosphatase 2C domain-containing protein [Bellilinea sp.]|jgi:protein phosphatase